MKKLIIKNIGQFEVVEDYKNSRRHMIIEGVDDMEVTEENIDI